MALLPCARETGLVVEELPDETLVYDSERDKAMCLNSTAALVWKHCDGKTTPARMAYLLESKFHVKAGDDLVALALRQLEEYNLLTASSYISQTGLSRRKLIRRLGVAAAVPLITMMLVPTASAQASCTANEGGCMEGPECCSGCCSDLTCVPAQFCEIIE